MSIRFQPTNDSFFQAEMFGVPTSMSPVTLLLWVKVLATGQEGQKFVAAGHNVANDHNIDRDYGNRVRSAVLSSSNAASYAVTPDEGLPIGEWVLVAHRRESSTVGSIYTGRVGLASVTTASDITAQSDFPVSNTLFSLGSGDIQLAGGQTITSNILLAEAAVYNVALSDAQLDTIKEGASPSSIASSLQGLWATDGGDLTESLRDRSINTNNLSAFSVDGTAGAGAVPAVYDIDHPATQAAVAVSATLVQDINDTPFANRTNLHYTLAKGDTVGTLAYIMSGVDGATDAAGVMTLSPAGVNPGDKLILNVFDPSASDIHAADTVVLIGSVQVQ